MLVLWGHGRGMLFLPDNQTPEGAMDVISAASALMEPKDHKFDIIGFDACFMCVLEVVNDFAGACRYFVASPSLIPSTGWAYGEMLEAVGGLNAAPDPKNMSKIISKAYETKYQDKFSGSRLVQLSTIETARLPDLVAAFRTLGNEIARILDGGGPPTETLRKALTLARQIALTPPGAFDYVDAVDLANRLTGLLPKDFDPSLIAACKDFATKADGIFTEDRDLPSFLIWFPLQRGIYARWRPLYDKLNTSHESDSSETVGWARMLSRYHGMSDIPDREDGFMAPGNRIFMALRHRDQLKPRLEERIKTKERIDK
ncbi:MAG: clostripain-related cysteine peptidase [Dongiaceae bacterium]